MDGTLPRFTPIAVTGVDAERGMLLGEDGSCYREVETNTWIQAGIVAPRVVYLGTGRHGGGIVLRPLFVRTRIEDGSTAWVNATTGKPAPDRVRLP